MKRLVLLIAICAATNADAGEHLSAIKQVRVVATGASESLDAKQCLTFTLSNSAATTFLKKAVVITSNERHYQFLWSPCFVKGTAMVGSRPVQWKIEALGLASVTYEDGTEVLLGDNSKRENRGQ
jgi:hypothetical protein